VEGTKRHEKRHFCKLATFCCYSQSHAHTFNGPFSKTTRVSRYQKGKTNLDVTEARDSERQWHQLGHMQVCNSLQRDNHASTPPLKFFTGRMPFLPPNQQHQSTEGNLSTTPVDNKCVPPPIHTTSAACGHSRLISGTTTDTDDKWSNWLVCWSRV